MKSQSFAVILLPAFLRLFLIFCASADASRVLVYPFGHCLNSHLLNAERLSEILRRGGHDVDMVVSTAYRLYEHHNGDSEVTISRDQQRADTNNTTPGDDCRSAGDPCSATRGHASTETGFAKHAGSLNLIEFHSPPNFVPVCEYDTLDFMIGAPLAERFNALIDTSVKYCHSLLSDKALLRRLKDASYSVLVLESVDPCSRILADYLDRPFVLLVTTGLGHFDSNPRPPSYLPAAIAPFTSHMGFGERVVNLLMKLAYDHAIPTFMGFMEPFRALRRLHQLNSSLSIDETFNRASLKLVNSDFSVEYPAPIEPDTVMVGGFAVQEPTALSSDLEEFIDGSGDNGVIIVSFGTLVRRYSEDWTSIFLHVFGNLPQRVIWRYHGNVATNSTGQVPALPPNIRLMKWLPQSSLLAHRKTRLFVSHCGLNGLFEAAHFGVPVLAIPLSGDQLNNAAKLSDHLHMGVRVDIFSMTRDSLRADMERVLGDKSYAVNARRVAARLADQPQTAADRILFWIDYVIRHDGAAHLRSGAASMPLYQYLSLDVIGALIAVVLASFVLVALCSYKLVRFVVRLSIFCSSQLYGAGKALMLHKGAKLD